VVYSISVQFYLQIHIFNVGNTYDLFKVHYSTWWWLFEPKHVVSKLCITKYWPFMLIYVTSERYCILLFCLAFLLYITEPVCLKFFTNLPPVDLLVPSLQPNLAWNWRCTVIALPVWWNLLTPSYLQLRTDFLLGASLTGNEVPSVLRHQIH
jgi:hypothetical protein